MASIFTDQRFMASPFSVADELRNEAPFVKVKLPIIGKVWVTTTQHAASLILKDSTNFTVRKNNGKLLGIQWWMPRSIRLLANNMLSTDEPDHSRLRTLVDKTFRRDAILALEPKITQTATELAEDLFSAGPTADLLTGFARKLPLKVICELLGLKEEDQREFMDWADSFGEIDNLWAFVRALGPIGKMTKYIGQEIERQKQTPTKGLISELVEMQKEGAEISDDEVISMVFLLLIAGHETTTHVIAGGMCALLQNKEQKETILANDASLKLGSEELLRFVSAVQFTKPRNVANDIELEGVQLKKGDVIMPMIVAANGDPSANKCPHLFDVERKPNKHIAFGTGAHFCLGHQLARLEIATAVRVLFETYPNLKLAIPAEELKWRSRLGSRALASLPVIVE